MADDFSKFFDAKQKTIFASLLMSNNIQGLFMSIAD